MLSITDIGLPGETLRAPAGVEALEEAGAKIRPNDEANPGVDSSGLAVVLAKGTSAGWICSTARLEGKQPMVQRVLKGKMEVECGRGGFEV